MSAVFQDIDLLPRRTASQVKNDWGDLRREVNASGGVAVTIHNEVEMVFVRADAYRSMKVLADAAELRHDESLTALTAEFDQRLAGMRAADAGDAVQTAMRARGKLANRPRAGEGF